MDNSPKTDFIIEFQQLIYDIFGEKPLTSEASNRINRLSARFQSNSLLTDFLHYAEITETLIDYFKKNDLDQHMVYFLQFQGNVDDKILPMMTLIKNFDYGLPCLKKIIKDALISIKNRYKLNLDCSNLNNHTEPDSFCREQVIWYFNSLIDEIPKTDSIRDFQKQIFAFPIQKPLTFLATECTNVFDDHEDASLTCLLKKFANFADKTEQLISFFNENHLYQHLYYFLDDDYDSYRLEELVQFHDEEMSALLVIIKNHLRNIALEKKLNLEFTILEQYENIYPYFRKQSLKHFNSIIGSEPEVAIKHFKELVLNFSNGKPLTELADNYANTMDSHDETCHRLLNQFITYTNTAEALISIFKQEKLDRYLSYFLMPGYCMGGELVKFFEAFKNGVLYLPLDYMKARLCEKNKLYGLNLDLSVLDYLPHTIFQTYGSQIFQNLRI